MGQSGGAGSRLEDGDPGLGAGLEGVALLLHHQLVGLQRDLKLVVPAEGLGVNSAGFALVVFQGLGGGRLGFSGFGSEKKRRSVL